MVNKYRCVCCGYKTLEHDEALYYEICPVCFWENDPIQNENPDYRGGANRISLNQAKTNYTKYGAVKFSLKKYTRPPLKSEKEN